MNGAAVLARKELRALIGAWLTIAAGVLIGELPGFDGLRELSIVGYAAGAAALGALSIGHEYRCGTLAQLLVQPAPRTRLFAVKMGVLALLLSALAVVALLFPLAHTAWPIHGVA